MTNPSSQGLWKSNEALMGGKVTSKAEHSLKSVGVHPHRISYAWQHLPNYKGIISIPPKVQAYR